MKNKISNLVFALLAVLLFATGCSELDSAGQAHITFAQAWSAQWTQDTVYAIFSIVSGLIFGGYSYYISKYKEWGIGETIIGVVLLMLFTGIMFGMPLTTMLNTTQAAAARGHYIL